VVRGLRWSNGRRIKYDNWLPDDTIEAFKEYLVGIKGPLTTPVGGRNSFVERRVAARLLDLYVCLRPVQYFHRGYLLQSSIRRKSTW